MIGSVRNKEMGTVKKRFVGIILTIILFALSAGSGWSDETGGSYPRMRPDRETRQRWISDYQKAPRARMDTTLTLRSSLTGSLSLLSRLDYTPSQRDQGSCGNCWAWAGTGIMEIALDVEEGIHARLSLQYLNSCDGTGYNYACCGGWLEDLADFYAVRGRAIPWSNTNASWQDRGRSCGSGSSTVSCVSIATSPAYPIASIEVVTVPTQGISRAQAIANIKNILNQNRAVWFAFFTPRAEDFHKILAR